MTQAGGCTDNACRRRPPNQFGSGVAALAGRSACAGKTGKEYIVKVDDDEGIANHIGTKPCVGTREGVGEASGRETSRPSYTASKSRKSKCRRRAEGRKATRRFALSQANRRLRVVEEFGMFGHSLHGNREVFGSTAMLMAARIGKVLSRSR